MTDPASSLPLLVWLSPAFPVGAFTYSQGLEWAVEAEIVREADSLAVWLDDLVSHGAIRADCVLLAATWRAPDTAAALGIGELAMALAPSQERRLETGAQGAAFLRAVAVAWPARELEKARSALGERDVAYPVAVGLAAAAHAIPLRATLEAFALAAVTNLVSAALRLGTIGQSDAQTIIAGLCPALGALAADAEITGLDEIGTCAFRADVCAMRHETQYSRLFRS